MLSTSFNYIYEQRNSRFPTKIDYWLFKDGCQMAGSSHVGLTLHTDSGFADNIYCLPSFIMDF